MDHKSDQLVLEVSGKKEKQQNGLESIFQWQLCRKTDWKKTSKQMQTANDLWEAVAWSQARMNKLPSEHSRMNDTSLKTHELDGIQWYTVFIPQLFALLKSCIPQTMTCYLKTLQLNLDRIHV